MEQILSTQIYKFTACLLKLSFFSFLHHVLKVSWDVSEERAAYFIVTESSSGKYQSNYDKGIFLLYNKVGGGYFWTLTATERGRGNRACNKPAGIESFNKRRAGVLM